MSNNEKKASKEDQLNQELITQTVIQVLKSLNIVKEDGSINKPSSVDNSKDKNEKHEGYVSSKFGMSNYSSALDDALAESSKLPIFGVEGAKKSFAGTSSAGVTQGPMDQDKMRVAYSGNMGGTPTGFGRGHTSFMGLQMDPLISNNFSMLNFSLSRSNPYLVNRQYGSGMYGDIPVYFMMMQEQNGGLLYWPVNIREKYNWFRYFTRCFTNPNVLITKADGEEVALCELKKGQQLINAKGENTEIECITKQKYEGQVYKISAVGMQAKDNLEVTPEHPFLVVRRKNVIRHYNKAHGEDSEQYQEMNVEINFEKEWVEAKDLCPGDYLITPRVNFSEDDDIEESLARLVGYYTSKGNVSIKSGEDEYCRWSLSSHESEIIEEICDLIKIVTGEKAEIDGPCRGRESVVEIKCYDKDLIKFMVENVGKELKNKKFSDKIFRSSKETVKHILATWMNGDGCIGRENSDYVGQTIGTTTSSVMANQIYLMAVRAGLCISKYEGKPLDSKEEDEGPKWNLIIPPLYSNQLEEYMKCSSVNKRFRHRKHMCDGNMLLPIQKIEVREFSGYIYNLQTNGREYDDRTFLVYGVATHNTDPHVGAAIDLHTDLPVSRVGFTMPKLKKDPTGEKARSCLSRCQKWADKISLSERIQELIYEFEVIGNCFPFLEWDEMNKWWKKMTILPPEEVGIVHFPFCDFAFAEYRPQPLIQLVASVNGGAHTESGQSVTPLEKAIYDNIPEDVVNSIQQFGSILMDTDPMTGSFVAHLARKRSPYADLGVSRLERVIVPLLQKEHFKYTQLSLSSRLMTPRNKISAPGISPDATDNLRAEIDMSMEDPDYHVVTNFDFNWEQIGAENRLIQLQPEYERIESEIFAALGVTREIITGEASYGGARLTAEILNTRYLLVRDILQDFVEKKLLYPMAVANEWYEEVDGEREYYYPKLTFNRLTIRDNQEMFDALFQMYQKGSLPVQVIYEIFNLNPDEMNDLLVDDLFTVRDSTFNEMTRQIHTDLASMVAEKTDIFDRVVKYCGLTPKTEEGDLINTPVPDIGEHIFTAPKPEKESVTEEEPVEEEGGGGLEEALGGLEEVGDEVGEEATPEEGGGEEVGGGEEIIVE